MKDRAFFFRGDTLLLPADLPDAQAADGLPQELANDFENPDVFDLPAAGNHAARINAVSVPPGAVLPASWKSIPVRQVLTLFVTGVIKGDVSNILRSCHIAQWRHMSRYCGTCGAENTDGAPEPLAATHRICPKCGRLEFPRICPAIIVVITDNENRILLAHNKKFKAGVYSLIAGFNEAGESLEETVVREAQEEVNIEIKDVTYIKSQPWPFPNSLMLGFKARYLSGSVKPDGIEIEDAKWFTKDSLLGQASLPMLPAEGSLSRALINAWLGGSL
jgi:NAD+ diphosphatase